MMTAGKEDHGHALVSNTFAESVIAQTAAQMSLEPAFSFYFTIMQCNGNAVCFVFLHCA